MKRPWFTIEDLRAAFSVRAAGTPHPDLAVRIREATRRTPDRPNPLLARWRGFRPNLARLVAFTTAAVVLGGAASGVGAGFDQLVRPLTSGFPSTGALAAMERTEDEAEDKAEGGGHDDEDDADDEADDDADEANDDADDEADDDVESD